MFRNHNGVDDDYNKYRRAQQFAAHFLRQSHRHLPSDVLRIRVRRTTGVRGCQLHVLGRQGQETSQVKEQRHALY